MSQIQGQAAGATVFVALGNRQALDRLPELKYIPRKFWQDYINIHDPLLPVAANLGVSKPSNDRNKPRVVTYVVGRCRSAFDSQSICALTEYGSESCQSRTRAFGEQS